MRFYSRKKRSPQLIIVSLVDILAILLIFFIVSTTFRKEQPRLKINLPESQSAEAVAAEKLEPLILRIKSADEINLGPDPVTLEGLPSALKSVRAAEPNRQIAMQADKEAPFGVVVKALDALKQAGMKNISAFTLPESK